MKLDEIIKEKTDYCNAVIKQYLPKETGYAAKLAEAVNYSILAGGKRLRPLLMAETCRMFSGQTKQVEPFMMAIECMHTASLVHDDLPAIDNDTYRRGKQTTHSLYGESTGILAGDALLNYAFEIAAAGLEDAGDPVRYGQALVVLSRAGGINGMLGGQYVDVIMTGQPLDEKLLHYIFQYKTGAFLACCLEIGGIMGGASAELQLKLREAGEKIGIAFQIQDDILDVTGTQEELGKPIGSDIRNEKTTYVSLFGLERAKEASARLTDEAIALMKQIDAQETFLPELFAYLVRRKK